MGGYHIQKMIQNYSPAGRLENAKAQRIQENINQTNQRMQNYLNSQKQQQSQSQNNQSNQIPAITNSPQTGTQAQQNAMQKTSVAAVPIAGVPPANNQTTQPQQMIPNIPMNLTGGGTNAPANQFILPNTQGIQFGGS